MNPVVSNQSVDTSVQRSVAVLVALVALTFALGACNYRVDKSKSGGDTGGGEKPFSGEVPNFLTLKTEILDKRCNTCHNGVEQSDLTTYSSVKASLADIRDRVTRTDAKRMPKGKPLTDEQLKTLLAWIDAGAPEVVERPNRPEATPAPGTEPIPLPTPIAAPTPRPGATPQPGELPDFQTVLSAVFEKRCVGCHDGVDHPDGTKNFDISDFSQASRLANEISRRVKLPEGNPQRMPSKKPLSAEQIQLIEDWIAGGARDSAASPNPTPTPIPTPVPSATPIASPTPTPQPSPTASPTPSPSEILPTYESINSLIFKPRKCLNCHTGGDLGDLEFSMGSLFEIMNADREAVTKKNPQISRLIRAVSRTDDDRMPPLPRAALSTQEIDILKTWIELGCPP